MEGLAEYLSTPGSIMADISGGNERNLPDRPWEEEILYGDFRRWHIMFLSIGTCLSVVIFFCCIFKCRVPRTKQEIEADFIRRQLAMKFRRQLDILKHSEMDEMDLLKALDRLRDELRADTASIAQSEAFSTLSFTPTGTPTYRKGSEINLGLSLEDLHMEAMSSTANLSLKGRVSNFLMTTLQMLKQCERGRSSSPGVAKA